MRGTRYTAVRPGSLLVFSWCWKLTSPVLPTLAREADCASSVVFHSLCDLPQCAVLFLFFAEAYKEQKVEDVLRMLLKQLIENFQTTPNAVLKEYESTKRIRSAGLRLNSSFGNYYSKL